MNRCALLLCFVMVGCLREPPEQQAEPLFPLDEVTVSANPANGIEPTPDPFIETPQTKPSGFTGIRVYGDPRTCNPCRLLDEDLHWLREKHGWTVSTSTQIAADWQILPVTSFNQRIPLIEVWRDGVVIHSEEGYSNSEDWELRKPALARLVKMHPKRMKN